MGGVLEDLDGGADALEVGDAACVVVVPVGEERLGDGCVFGGEDAGEEGRPGREAFACVDENAVGAGADEVGICAWSEAGGSVVGVWRGCSMGDLPCRVNYMRMF